MRRLRQRDRSLAHLPFGWRWVAWCIQAVAAEHGVSVGMAVLWSPVSQPYRPILNVVEAVPPPGHAPANPGAGSLTVLVLMRRMARRARQFCMACGAGGAVVHVVLVAGDAPHAALLCDDCELTALMEGGDFWAVVGRYDPFRDGADDWENDPWMGGEPPGDDPGPPDDKLDEPPSSGG